MSEIKHKKVTLIIEDEDGLFEVNVSVHAAIQWAGDRWVLDDPDVGTRYADNLHAGLLAMLGTKLGTEP